ncbi:MAG: vanadium-dependent haloperoxidase [bacterium]|nr:vanadium-dependent haloperoxidase [bacterium]
MKSLEFRILLAILFAATIITSCSEDEGLEVSNNDFTEVESMGESQEFAEDINCEVVRQWTSMFLELDQYALGMRPNATARALAYINLAAYETVVPGMPDYESTEDQLDGFRIRNSELPEDTDWQIALNAAYADVLDHFMLNVTGDQKSQITLLESELESTLSSNVSSEVIEASKEWGAYVAEQVIEYSQSDKEAEEQILEPQPLSYEPPTGEGFWTYSADPERALFPYWESVRTFVISPKKTSTVAPIEYSEDPDSEYYEQMMEVYSVNNQARVDDDEQLWIAEFWSDDVEELMISPPARQFSIAEQLITQYEMNLEESLVLFLKLGFSLNDAAVATWKYKYEYMVMRPNVYIHEFIDPDFQTNLYRLVYWPNPSFPGYPSGHSCFASAAAGVFIDAFGNSIDFTDRTHEGRTKFRGEPRTFSSFEEMADENGYSRIPLGVHVRMDCTEGLRLGYEIADAVNELDLRK